MMVELYKICPILIGSTIQEAGVNRDGNEFLSFDDGSTLILVGSYGGDVLAELTVQDPQAVALEGPGDYPFGSLSL